MWHLIVVNKVLLFLLMNSIWWITPEKGYDSESIYDFDVLNNIVFQVFIKENKLNWHVKLDIFI